MKSALQKPLALLILVTIWPALPPSTTPRIAMAASPPAKTRLIKSFDSDWRFYQGELSGAEKVDFDDRSWRQLDVPHDWSIAGPFDKDNPTRGAGGFLPAGVGWYRKHFTLDPNDASRRLSNAN